MPGPWGASPPHPAGQGPREFSGGWESACPEMNGAERHVPGTTRKVQLQLLPLDEMLGSENFADGYTQLIVLCARLGLEWVLGQL